MFICCRFWNNGQIKIDETPKNKKLNMIDFGEVIGEIIKGPNHNQILVKSFCVSSIHTM